MSYGHTELIELLLGGGAHVNKGDEDGDTALHYCELPAVAELLILAGADVAAVNNYNETVLDKAVENENEEMVEFWVSTHICDYRKVSHERLALFASGCFNLLLCCAPDGPWCRAERICGGDGAAAPGHPGGRGGRGRR